MAAFFVVAEAVTAEHEKPRIGNGLLGSACAGFQSGQRHEGLVGGAGRVGAAQCAIEQRFIGRLVQGLPALAVNAFDKQVGVKGGFADKGQDLPGFGV